MMTTAAAAIMPSSPTIRRLSIERFRGIGSLSWLPAAGVNVILGGGDVGKTTILDAIALLLSPINPANLPDTDYHSRNLADGFVIEAVVSLPPGSGVHDQQKHLWPWEWNGSEALVPDAEDKCRSVREPVYRLRIRGTEDLELVYEINQPDGSADFLSIALRRSIGLVRLGGDDRNDRDLRLVQGSALDRLLSDKSLRSRMASEFAKGDVRNELTEGAQKALVDLDLTFKSRSLPDGLDLAITGGQGVSIASLVGLTADRNGTRLPLASWGSGTRRLAALAIAEQNQSEAPITIVDEIERGLEPYRQRVLMEKLEAGKSQVFVTTHSPTVISASSKASLWYVDHTGRIGPLDAGRIARHRIMDPETFLSRFTAVAEGATEVGFTTALLERALCAPLELHGIRVSDGRGHENTLGLLEALAEGGLGFGGFADDEGGKYPERWKRLGEKLGKLLFRWPAGCVEQNVVGALHEDKLEALLIDPAGEKTGSRLRTLADRLAIVEKDFPSIRAGVGKGLKTLVIEAALGTVPAGKEAEKNEYKAHAGIWFKSIEGGRELGDKLFSLGLWPALKPQLLPFCNAVRKAVGLPEVPDLS
jgi:putative ATP-dependent endonuclease of OLD family